MTSSPRNSWLFATMIFVITLLLYGLVAQMAGGFFSPLFSYYDQLAGAFLDGELSIQTRLPHDLTFYNGKWYVPFPPLPAILMLPFTAIVGVEGTKTVLFSIVLGAINTAIVFLMLESMVKIGWSQLNRSGNIWLTVLFGFGCVHWYMAIQGTIWFVAQIVAFTFLALATLLAIRTGSALLSGAALALAMLARPHLGVMLVFLAGITWQHAIQKNRENPLQHVVIWCAVALLPIALTIGGMFAYNQARFDDWRDFGYLTQNVDESLEDDLATYGQFNTYFIPRNLESMLLALPVSNEDGGGFSPDVNGLSLLIVTPALIYLGLAFKRSWMVLGAWVSIGLVLIPLLTYYNTGWWQFGYRFSLDFMPPVMILLAVAAGSRVSWLMRLLIVIGVVVNAWGTLWFLSVTGRFG